ncbi:magnesium transporter [Brasilonema sp. CT11]|nr:magnesium transporter [Brasilonema sp. CT11]
MQPDLLSLEITKGELRRLIGLNPDDVLRPSIIKDREKRFRFLINEIVVALLVSLIIVGFVYAFVILPTIGSSIILGIVLLTTVLIAIIVGRWFWRRFTYPRTLRVLLDQVDKYHKLVIAIAIHDQQITSGNTDSRIADREKVLAALQLIREDFVRALKTERILRDNKELFTNNQELLVNNLTKLQALQVSSQASEYAQILNQSLQIAMSVQTEITKLREI